MIGDLKTDDEEGRIRALERFEVLDTGEEQPFETVVNMVRQILQVPMCAVSLVDRHRQWFKASRGLEVDETDREISFCTHAIQQGKEFIVSDAVADPLFCDNPLVTGGPRIRSYAGIPLKTPDGYNVGTLCAIDTKSRAFTEYEIDILVNFAKVVVEKLELRLIASVDGLTGTLTRRAWSERAAVEVERAHRYGRSLSMAIADIDTFKAINDAHGHLVGDMVIEQLAELLEKGIRRSDLLGRFGGEEFVLLMPETKTDQALIVVERLRNAFARSAVALEDGTHVKGTVSWGLTEFAEGDTFDTLLERADQALFTAKEAGRNRSVSEAAPPPTSRPERKRRAN